MKADFFQAKILKIITIFLQLDLRRELNSRLYHTHFTKKRVSNKYLFIEQVASGSLETIIVAVCGIVSIKDGSINQSANQSIMMDKLIYIACCTM